MEPKIKRARREADVPSRSPTPKSTSDKAASTVPQAAGRKLQKVHLTDEPENSRVSDDDEAAPISDCETAEQKDVVATNADDIEDALVREGDKLSGKALQDFLQKNFVEFADDQLFDVGDLESLLATKP